MNRRRGKPFETTIPNDQFPIIRVRGRLKRSGCAYFGPELDQPLSHPPASIRCNGEGEGSRAFAAPKRLRPSRRVRVVDFGFPIRSIPITGQMTNGDPMLPLPWPWPGIVQTFFPSCAVFCVDSARPENIVRQSLAGFSANPASLTDMDVSEWTAGERGSSASSA